MNFNLSRFIIALLIVIAVTIPTVIGFAYDWNIIKSLAIQYTISVYMISSFIHFVFQIIFAELNRRKVESVNAQNINNDNMEYAIQIVGFGENPEYFRQCLLHVYRILSYDQSCIRVMICIDGIDHTMAQVVREVFDDANMIDLTDPLYDMDLFARNQLLEKINTKITCIMQPHRGKRYAMYTASWLLINMHIPYICMTDSDTLLNVHVGRYLKQMMIDGTGAVTGLVKIFNIENYLAFIIDLKYWFAFNIERAAQSYFGSVACISGPLGLYRSGALESILEEWVNQEFLCRRTTYGDDRHLTNLLIRNGWNVRYSHKAVCYTETPTSLLRWFAQQARWGRSFMREYIISLPWIYSSLWLAYDMTYLVFYSIFLFTFSCINMTHLSLVSLLFTTCTVFAVTGLRVIYAMLLTGDSKFLCFLIYGAMYFVLLLPLKVWSTLTIFVTSWGTSTRAVRSSTFIDSFSVLIWVAYIVYGIVLAGLRGIHSKQSRSQSIAYIAFITFMLMVIYVTYQLKRKNLLKTQQAAFTVPTSTEEMEIV